MAALTERAGGVLPPVTVDEMEGQLFGKTWYIDDDDVLAKLTERARRYAGIGVHRMSVGLPLDDADRLRTALERLTAIGDAVA